VAHAAGFGYVRRMAINKTYDAAEPVRINKWLAQSGLCSRREADALIAEGRVRIDGETVTDAGRKILSGQTLTLDDDAAADLQSRLTILYHKPVGIVSGQPEPGETPAVRMIRRANVYGPADVFPGAQSKLAPVGRLDKDSRGLLVLSEDGVLAKAIIGPESELEKEYRVRVRGEIFEEKLKWLRHGLELDGRKLKPAQVTQTNEQSLTFILSEGRNRQIRRMCNMCELRVIDLFRVRIGPLQLGNLPEGQWRLLTPEERKLLVGHG
jgi:23S rRNA pseudouridine2604 synthase